MLKILKGRIFWCHFRFRIYLWQQRGRLWSIGKRRRLCVRTQVHDRKLQADLCDVYSRYVTQCSSFWYQLCCRYPHTPVSGQSLVRGHLSKSRKNCQYKAVNTPPINQSHQTQLDLVVKKLTTNKFYFYSSGWDASPSCPVPITRFTTCFRSNATLP